MKKGNPWVNQKRKKYWYAEPLYYGKDRLYRGRGGFSAPQFYKRTGGEYSTDDYLKDREKLQQYYDKFAQRISKIRKEQRESVEGIDRRIKQLKKEKVYISQPFEKEIKKLRRKESIFEKILGRLNQSAQSGYSLEPVSRKNTTIEEYADLLDKYEKKNKIKLHSSERDGSKGFHVYNWIESKEKKKVTKKKKATGKKKTAKKKKTKGKTMNGLGFELFSSESDDYLEMSDMEAGLDALEKFHNVSTSIFGNLFSDKKEEMSFDQMVNIIKNSRGGTAQIEGLGMGIKFNRMSEGDVKAAMERAWKANKRYPKTAGDISILRSALQETSTQLSFPDIINVAKSTALNIGEDLAQVREVGKATATQYTKWSKYAFPIGVAFVGAITIMILRSQVTGTFKGLKSLAKTTRKRMKRR